MDRGIFIGYCRHPRERLLAQDLSIWQDIVPSSADVIMEPDRGPGQVEVATSS